jgi:UDP-N-acetylmuramate dehydrogenase
MGFTNPMTLVLQKNRYLSEFSTFGIGGKIALFAEVSTKEQLKHAFSLNIPYLIIGKGSNCLFPDRGFDGLVILNKIDFCHWEDTCVHVGAGYSFSLLGVQSARKNLSGLEFASGIPASVGGAIFMNAGASGSETCQSLSQVEFMHEDGTLEYFTNFEGFSYRKSIFQNLKGAIVSAVFRLSFKDTARDDQLKIIDYRLKTQPYKDKSIGCIFKNPPNQSAGKLIEQAGLKGMRFKGVKVSELHANFIVNENAAMAEDVLNMIALVQERVFEHSGIYLEPEIRIV